jgi:hypothetical protein
VQFAAQYLDDWRQNALSANAEFRFILLMKRGELNAALFSDSGFARKRTSDDDFANARYAAGKSEALFDQLSRS